MTSTAFRLFATVAVTLQASGSRAAATPRLDLPAGSLTLALTALGRQAGVDILFSDAVIGDRRVNSLHGQMTVAAALQRLLAGTGLSYSRTSEAAFIITAAAAASAKQAPVPESIPEILIVARRAQNSDIRRTQDDIQPYQVYTGRDVRRAGSSSVNEFARTRLSANATTAAPAQFSGDTRSDINLRGLGSDQTLVLVDGRRLPSIPDGVFVSYQPDLNALPVELIERVEVLTATAGGIYGTGAIAGTVNVILKRDYRGVEFSTTAGLTSRGDAFGYRLFGRIGFTPDHGRTNIMFAAGRSREETLRASQRDFIERAVKRRFANGAQVNRDSLPVGNGINIAAIEPLVFDAAAGGAALGSTFTTLPLNLGANDAKRNATLLANAGQVNLERVSNAGNVGIFAPLNVRSFFLSIRHDFGGGVEATADLIDTRNIGQRLDILPLSSTSFVGDNPGNPFRQTVSISFPDVRTNSRLLRTVNEMRRITAGLLFPLPVGWRASVELGGGYATAERFRAETRLSVDFYRALRNRPNGSGKPPLDPLGDWSQFRSSLRYYTTTSSSWSRRANRFRDYSLRLAGPMITLAGGRATMTLLAQQRREKVPEAQETYDNDGFLFTSGLPGTDQRTRSLYGETRLPLIAEKGFFGGLEIQLAARQDWTRYKLQDGAIYLGLDQPELFTQKSTTLYTVGAKFRPLPQLVLRASTATGALPPTTSQMGSLLLPLPSLSTDPRRGGRLVGTEAAATVRVGGRPDLRPERARSVSIGGVVLPSGNLNPRFSIDFTRITKHDEIVALPFATNQLLIDNESSYPDRVTRGQLSGADRALGFTGGPIISLDKTSINLGKTRIDTFDVAADYSVPVSDAGSFDFYLRATWEPTFKRRSNDRSNWTSRLGFSDGPLTWRGNVGVDWTRGRITLGFNAQLYSRYKVAYQFRSAVENVKLIASQGSAHIPAQGYVDLTGIYRFGARLDGGGACPELRWGVLNVFDKRPPTLVDPQAYGYSYYGDPRRRRVQLTLNIPLAN